MCAYVPEEIVAVIFITVDGNWRLDQKKEHEDRCDRTTPDRSCWCCRHGRLLRFSFLFLDFGFSVSKAVLRADFEAQAQYGVFQ